jgi:hypothetical protein
MAALSVGIENSRIRCSEESKVRVDKSDSGWRRSSVHKPVGEGALLGYARVSKGTSRPTPSRPRRYAPPAAAASSRKRHRVADGIAPNCTACSTSSVRMIRLLFGNSIAYRAR